VTLETATADLVSDSITSISCGFVVQLVVQHVVRQAASLTTS